MNMKHVVMGLLSVGCSWVLNVQATSANEDVAKLVFAGTQGMPMPVQYAVADQLVKKGFSVEQGKIVSGKCGKVSVLTEVKDLNADGKHEAIVVIGNECTSGKIGATLYLFTQEADGSVQRHFGFSASGYQLLAAKNDPWPAVLVQGTGGCQPVWRYKNGRYAFNNLYEDRKGACAVPESGGHGG